MWSNSSRLPWRHAHQEDNASSCSLSSLLTVFTAARELLSTVTRKVKMKKNRNTPIPANEEELPEHPQSPHSHQETSDSHALAEAHHHASFGKAFPQFPQKAIEVLFPSVAVDLVRMSDAQAFLRGQLLERLHATFAIIAYKQ